MWFTESLVWNDCQIDGDTFRDVEHVIGSSLGRVVNDAVDTGGLAERPQVVTAVSGKVAELCISSAINRRPGLSVREAKLTLCSPAISLLGW